MWLLCRVNRRSLSLGAAEWVFGQKKKKPACCQAGFLYAYFGSTLLFGWPYGKLRISFALARLASFGLLQNPQ